MGLATATHHMLMHVGVRTTHCSFIGDRASSSSCRGAKYTSKLLLADFSLLSIFLFTAATQIDLLLLVATDASLLVTSATSTT